MTDVLPQRPRKKEIERKDAQRKLQKVRQSLFAALRGLGPIEEHVPELGRVSVIGSVAGAEEVQGRNGVALAGGPDESGEWSYTVLIDTLNETYILPESAINFLGWTVPKDAMYTGEGVKVRVDKHGHGTKVRELRKRAK